METMNLAQSTRHAVQGRLGTGGNREVEIEAVVAEALKSHLKGLAAADPEARQGAREIARGAMTATVLGNGVLALAALAVLRGTVEAALDAGFDPSMLVESALEGIADIRRIAPLSEMALIQFEVEQQFMGTGEAFRKLMEKADVEGVAPLM